MNYEYPHPLARHWTHAPFACNSPLVMRIEPSCFPRYESYVVTRCSHCGRIQSADGVIPEPESDE